MSLGGKVALITGAGRGQGRAHAVKLAELGAEIVAIDICADIASIDYSNAQPDDLHETAGLVRDRGRQIIVHEVDVRDADAMQNAVDDAVSRFGRLDVVIANAGIVRLSKSDNEGQVFRDIVDVNLIGAWNDVQAAIPALIAGGRGGSIVITSSTAGLKAVGSELAGNQAYTASKRALVGLMQCWANLLAPHSIRVNTIHPTGVATGMVLNDAMAALFAANDPALATMQNALPIEMLQPEDVAKAVAFLVSDDAAFITGTAWPLDAGFTVR